MKKILGGLFALVALVMSHGPAMALSCSPFPFTLTNGTTADANQVMADFNILPICIANIPGTPITWTALQTFNSGELAVAGATSGTTLLNASAAASGALTFPAATDQLVARATTDTLTNKTISGGTMTGVTTFPGSTVIDGSGRLGLQATPNTNWNTSYGVVQLNSAGAVLGSVSSAAISSGWYSDGTNNRYLTTTPISRMTLFGGAVIWDGAPSGTAGNVATLTTNMMLDASGRLGIGVTPSNILDIAQNQNTYSQAQILNNNGGTSAQVQFTATNGTSQGTLVQFGSGYTTNGVSRQNGTQLFASGAGGLTLTTTAAQPIYFGINSVQAYSIDTNRHHITSGPNPTCGANCLSVSGNDNAFTFTSVATNQTSFVVNFGASWSNPPVCNVNSNVLSAASLIVASVSTSSINIQLNTTTASVTFYVRCIQ